MRICLDIRVQTKGGTSTFIDSFVRQLMNTKTRHQFVFLTLEETNYVSHPECETITTPLSNPLLQVGWIQGVLPNVLRNKKIDIYHSLKHMGPLWCPTKSIYNIAAVGQYCDIYPLSPLEGMYWNRLQKLVMKRADCLVAVSDYIRSFLIERLHIPEERVVTIYNGLDEYFHPLNGEEIPVEFLSRHGIQRPFILCVGNVVPVKNQETAIKAYNLLKQYNGIDEDLIIAGATNHAHALKVEDLVRGLGLKDRVKFIGYQTKQDMLYLYNCAEMLVHPSLHEGFSYTILEAMSCGLPIVCSRTTSNPEAAGEAAVFYNNPEDAEELAMKMKAVIDSRNVRARAAVEGVKRSRQFSWTNCVKNTIALYDYV